MLELFPTKRPPGAALETASRRLLGRRAVAHLVDLVLCYVLVEAVLLAGVIVVFRPAVEANTTAVFFGSVVLLVPLSIVYSFVFEWQFGRTPGKTALGLMVARTDGEPAGVVACGVRNLLRYVDLLPGPYLVGLVVAGVSGSGQRVGDRLAGTVVVRPDWSSATTDASDRVLERAAEREAGRGEATEER